MNTGEEYIVKTEKLINGGNALARIDNTPVFIKNACPDELVKIKITKINKNYLEGEITEIIEKSKFRVTPICALHNVCGSCSLQYLDYKEQLNQKKIILSDTLKKIAGINTEIQSVIPSPRIQCFRCKIQLPVSQTKISKRLLSGYYKKNSHELINIKYCPMQPDIINKINEFIKEEAVKLNICGYDEKTGNGLLRHIIYRLSSDLEQILIIFVLNSETIPAQIKKISDILIEAYPQITGICANFNTKKTNVIMGKTTKCIAGNDFYIETLDNIKFKISSNSFFQVNPLCAEKIFNKVKEIIQSKTEKASILDAYSGVSSFGIWLSSIASNIVCIEEEKSASINAKSNAEMNNIKNIEIINGDAAVEFKKLIKRGLKFDVSVVDPPRKGCSEDSIEALTALTSKYIIYVSCNPSTLARDMKLLKEKGFNPEYIQPADMFPHTPHIETIVLFEREI